jgi:micrococcal nuclease
MRELAMIWMSMLAGLILLAFGASTNNEQTSHTSPPQQELATTSLQQTKSEQRAKMIPTYPVVKVIDGDTVVIKRNGKNETLRLIGMDAPETTTLRKGTVECFGKEATHRAEELLERTSVSLETDASQGTYDKYERTLAYIFLPNGRNFAEVMIKEGYAHEYTYSAPYTYQKEFKAAEALAKQNKAGLWNQNACSDTTMSQVPTAIVAIPGTYECSKNTYNCTSFKSKAEAQAAFDSCGGSNNDIHKLDNDGDGQVCEGL